MDARHPRRRGGSPRGGLPHPRAVGYQRNRLRAFLDPSLDPQGIGYQTRQVRIAIGSGGPGGQGLFEGRQTQGGFIPFRETDFMFSVAGEELGFVGVAGVVGVRAFENIGMKLGLMPVTGRR